MKNYPSDLSCRPDLVCIGKALELRRFMHSPDLEETSNIASTGKIQGSLHCGRKSAAFGRDDKLRGDSREKQLIFTRNVMFLLLAVLFSAPVWSQSGVLLPRDK